MNEGENSNIPQGPNFSSPNISSGNGLAQTPVNATTSTPQPITNSDISAMAGTDAGAVAAAAAAMPESDARRAISSTPAASSAGSSRSRFGFGGRKFNASAQQPVGQPAFAGAPDYFNQAAGDIAINNSQADNGKKKFIIIAAVAVIVILIVVLLVFMMPSAKKDEMAEMKPSEVDSYMFDDATRVAVLEEYYSRILSGNADLYELNKDDFCNEIKSGVDSYSSLKNKIERYIKYRNDNFTDQFKDIYSHMNSEKRYDKLGEKCVAAREYIKGNSSDIEGYGENYVSALKKVAETKKSYEAVEKKYRASACRNEDLEYIPSECRAINEEEKQLEKDVRSTAQLIKNDILGAYSYDKDEVVGSKILNLLINVNGTVVDEKNN